MTHPSHKQNIKIPEPALRRLPWYLAYVKLLKGKGELFVSSTQIAKEIGLDPSQVAKDLSYVNISGKTRVGYDMDALILILEDFLGFTSTHNAVLFGAGRLGGSLLLDSGLNQYGLNIVAAFDVQEDLIGREIGGIPIFHIADFLEKQKQYAATIGVLTVPVEKAQEVTDHIVLSKIHAIWNFTPFRIRVPEDVIVQNTSIYAHLAVMYNRIKLFD